MKLAITFLIVVFLSGCSSNPNLRPSYTFKLAESCSAKADCSFTLDRHSESTIAAREGSVVRLAVKKAYLTSLSEKSATKKGQLGNRELLLYATIYKNGQFLRYAKITDIAEHVSIYQSAVVHKPIFFTEAIDGYYHIIIKGYEVDTKTLVKALRRVRTTDVEAIENSSFSPGDTFTTGLKDVVFGLFDMVLSFTGKSLDDWAAHGHAAKLFEHSIYVVKNDVDFEEENLLIIGSGDERYFEKCEQERTDEKCSASSDQEIFDAVSTKIQRLENGKPFTKEDLKKGKVVSLSKSPYLWIFAENLTNQ